jgi:tripartite ATP-independent transporter DctP family solute receptor
MSKSVSFFIVGLLTGALAASGLYAWLGVRNVGSGASVAGGKVLRVAHALPTSHPVHQGILFMAKRVEELSGGKLKLEVFPGEQLGTETQCLEQVQAGTLAITKVSCGAVGNFVSTYKVFGLPYLFRDESHLWNVLEGPVGEDLLKLISVANDGQPSGLTGLCFYDAGSRNFYGKSPITTPADLKGKKIRVMNDQVAMDLITAFGGAPTPIPWGELYTSLQQGVVDGAENNPPSLLSSRHYEVCKFYTLDHHTRLPDVLVMSSKIFDKLSPEEEGWISKASRESTDYQRKLWAEETARSLAELKKAGVDVREVDMEPFRKMVGPVIEKYAQGKVKELVEQIEAVK